MLREYDSKGPRPIFHVDRGRVRSRMEDVDWFADDTFSKPVDETLQSMSQTPGEICHGAYAVTLTLRSTSRYLADGKAKYDPMLREIKRRLRSKPATIDYLGIVDLHLNGLPHIHGFMLVRNDAEATLLRKFLAWWQGSHGITDAVPLRSKLDAQRWVNYCLRPQVWHSNVPQDKGLDAVSVCRELGWVVAKTQPRVLEIRVASDDPEPSKVRTTVQYPSVFVAAGRSFGVDLNEVGYACNTCADLIGDTHQTRMLQRRFREGPIATLNAWIRSAMTTIPTAALKQFIVDKMTDPKVVEIYLDLVSIAGYGKAFRFLYNSLVHADPKFFWKSAASLRRSGLKPGLLIRSTRGTRREWDLRVTEMFGANGLSPEEVGELVERSNTA